MNLVGKTVKEIREIKIGEQIWSQMVFTDGTWMLIDPSPWTSDLFDVEADSEKETAPILEVKSPKGKTVLKVEEEEEPEEEEPEEEEDEDEDEELDDWTEKELEELDLEGLKEVVEDEELEDVIDGWEDMEYDDLLEALIQELVPEED